jgi:tetratricopeptide (TPR) repeat protein
VQDEFVSRPSPHNKLGKYTILGLISRGSMGMVYLAHDALLERDVAIKVMVGASVFDKAMRARFESEARAVARLHHPNIITIHDLGYDQNGSPFIAMELLQGMDLDELIDTDPPPLGRRLDIIAQVCRGLAHAHRHGVVHRDIKPANIFVTDDGCAKIMDFGVARIAQTSQSQAGMVVGTAGYMSPEQLRGKPADGRSDIFSLGITVFEILTNELLFSGDTVEAIFFQTLSKPVPRLVMPDGTELPELQKILDRALAKDAEERYWSTDEMEASIRDFLNTCGEVAEKGVFLSLGGTEQAPQTDGPARRERAPSGVTPESGRRGSAPIAPITTPAETPIRRQVDAPVASTPSVRPRVPTGRRRRRSTSRVAVWSATGVVSLAAGVGSYLFLSHEPATTPAVETRESIVETSTEIPLAPSIAHEAEPEPVSPPETTPREKAALLAADAALALANGDLEEADALLSQGERLDPDSPRWAPLRYQLRVKTVESQRKARAASYVHDARGFLEAGSYQEAIDAYKNAVVYDPQNRQALNELDQAIELERQRVEEQERPAVTPRIFTESETEFVPRASDPGTMMGFEMEERLGVKETADALLPAQLVIELDPNDARPGEPFVLQVSVFNEGYQTLEFESLELVSRYGQKEATGKGQQLPVRTRQVPPQTKAVLHEVSGTWNESQNHGVIEVTATLTDGGKLMKTLRW